MEKDIVVICDSQEYDDEHVLQIITRARNLGDKCGSKVSTLCVGSLDEKKIDILFRYGADNVVICRQKEQFDNLYFTEIITEMVKQIIPKVILVPAAVNGKMTAAILAARFEAGLIADCIDIDLDENGELYFLKPTINNSVISKTKCINHSMMMGTVKKDTFIKKESDRHGKGTIKEFTYSGDKERISNSWEVLERLKEVEKKEIDISNYKRVFCIGRGVKNKETFERICSIAEKCGASIVGTRAVVEAGFIEKERMVGQTGKTLSSPIYVGFGVSGASQHMIGIKNAEIIVAINTDKNAAIFDYADYSIVNNIEVVLDELEKIVEA